MDIINVYLGLHTKVGSSKIHSFNSILDKVRNKLKVWKINNFSYVGMATMIKVVAQVIPIHYELFPCLKIYIQINVLGIFGGRTRKHIQISTRKVGRSFANLLMKDA